MGNARVTKGGTVELRGVHFPADNVRAAMLETGGIPVSDPEISKRLDRAMFTSAAAGSGKKVKALAIDDYPNHWFVPVKINLHTAPVLGGALSGGWLYFAVERKIMINA